MSMIFSDKLMLKDWNCKTPITDRTISTTRSKNMKETVLRNTQIRNMHEMGEMKRAQDLRVDVFSVQKWRESRETIQRLTSHMQEAQELTNSMSDSCEFQEVDWNHSERLSYVRS